MTRPRTIARLAAVAAVLLAWAARPALADLEVQVLDSTAQAGGTGSFDIVLTDTGGTYQVGGFGVELSVAGGPGVSFTAVDTGTADPYLFGTLQSPPFSFDTFPNTSFSATDTDFTSPGYVTLNPGDIYGLAHVSYAVTAGTPPGTVVSVSLDNNGGTSVTDGNGNGISFTPLNGTITVQTSVPEPSALALAGIGGAMASLWVHRTRSRHLGGRQARRN